MKLTFCSLINVLNCYAESQILGQGCCNARGLQEDLHPIDWLPSETLFLRHKPLRACDSTHLQKTKAPQNPSRTSDGEHNSVRMQT